MSDDGITFYNAWREVFNEVPYYLLCSWHVLRSWDRNLKSKIKDSDVREEVRVELEEAIHEVDLATFEKNIENFVQTYGCNDSAKEFVSYFKEHYLHRKEKWAYCYRIGCTVNTNMKLERWHKELKHGEAQGKVIKRLDKALELVQNAIAHKLLS